MRPINLGSVPWRIMHKPESYKPNVAKTAEMGLKGMTHWYGLPEALFTDRVIQNYPLDYNYSDEQHRFEEAGKLWKQAAGPGSDRWNSVMDSLLDRDFEINPTFTIYEASRDLMAQRRAEWHEWYTLPSLWEFYKPDRRAHGSLLVQLGNRAGGQLERELPALDAVYQRV